MAQQALNRTRTIIAVLLALGASALALLLAGPLRSLEEPLTSLKYSIRGDRSADTNIVIVYIDNAAARSLGWPIRRNYYALLMNTLRELDVAAVGVEILFEEPVPDYPEYDQLLAEIIRRDGNVVLPGYYGHVRETADGGWRGSELHRPLKQLDESAAAVGHLNLVDGYRIPMTITGEGGPVRAFGSEVARVAGLLPAVTDEPPEANLNFPGGIRAFRSYPFVEVLRSYQAMREGGVAVVPVPTFAGKIVLVGVIAEGRSTFVPTPVDPRYPSVGLHAVLIDNMLHHRFLSPAPIGVPVFCAFVLSFLTALLALGTQARWPAWVLPALLLATLAAAQFLFAGLSVMFPVIPVVLPAALAGIAGLWHRSKMTSRAMSLLASEKEEIDRLLSEREHRLRELESELHDTKARHSEERMEKLQSEIRRYREEIRSLSSRADDMVPSVQEQETGEVHDEGLYGSAEGPVGGIIELIGKMAGSNAPVLILGESGTGKELVARALHRKSPRAGGAFVAVNCGALSETLLESELFGHEKGAFTGAVRERAGRFELANGGTIFLDEIGEVTEGFQVKLLRVLQEGEFERVGGTQTLKVDVRVLAATNRDLKERIAARKFREDLYYRLNVLSIDLPPLRGRTEDIPVLVRRFLEREGPEMTISRNVMHAFTRYRWPGNIRELESIVKRGALLARAEGRTMVTLKDLSEEIRTEAIGAVPIEEQILQSMREKGFSRRSVTETAEELGGLNRGTVAEYLRGEFLKAFVEHRFGEEATVRSLAPAGDEQTTERVRKRLREYLGNITEAVDPEARVADFEPVLRSKMKNLPRQYHRMVMQIATAFHRREWSG